LADVQPTPAYVLERYRKNRHWRLIAKEFVLRKLQEAAAGHIFDFGCGEGEVTTQMAQLGGFVTAMDLSPELVEIAQKRAQLDSVDDRIRFLVGDVLESPPPDNSFDALVCNAVLHHVDLYRVLPVLMKTLKPGGTAIFLEP